MRTLISFRSAALLAIILVLSGSVLPSSAQSATPPSDQTPTFTALHMVSATNGWAVVTVPDTSPLRSSPLSGDTYPGTEAYIVHTEDGGQRWANVSPAMPQANVMPDAGAYNCDCSDNGFSGWSVLDDDHVWVMIDDAGFQGNQLFSGISLRKTSDAGQTWQNFVGAMNAPSVVATTFIDPTHGWLLAGNLPSDDGSDQPALLYRTSDGVRWDLISDDGSHSHPGSNPDGADEPISTVETGITAMMHKDMAFESETSGWMLVDSPDSTDAHLLHTTDGGVTWTRNSVLPNVNEDYCSVFQLQVSAPNITFMTGCISGRYFYQSSDDGQSWQNRPIPAYLLNFSGWPQAFMLNALTGWVLGCDSQLDAAGCDSKAKPFLYKTADAGKTWSEIGALPDALAPLNGDFGLQTLAQFDFVDDQTGWAIAPTDALFSTHDGGKTWTAIQSVIPGLQN